jgi:hypothetical protein
MLMSLFIGKMTGNLKKRRHLNYVKVIVCNARYDGTSIMSIVY